MPSYMVNSMRKYICYHLLVVVDRGRMQFVDSISHFMALSKHLIVGFANSQGENAVCRLHKSLYGLKKLDSNNLVLTIHFLHRSMEIL